MSDKNKVFLLTIFFVALFIRLGYIYFFVKDTLPTSDAASYDAIAFNLARGFGFKESEHFTATRLPAYPLFLSVIYIIFGQNYFVVKIIQSIMSAIICVLIFFVAKKIFNNDKIARYSAIISIVYPSLIIYSGKMLTEILMAFFLLVSMHLLLKFIECEKKIYLVLCGITSGIYILTKGEYFLSAIIPLIMFIMLKWNIKKIVVRYFVFLFIMLSTLTPWIVRNYIVFDTLLLSTRGGITIYNSYFIPKGGFSFNAIENIEKEYHLLESEVEKDKYLINKTVNFIKNNPAIFIKLIPVKIGMLFYPFDGRWYELNLFSKYNLIYGLVFCFSIVGIIYTLKNKEIKSYLLLLIILQMIIISSIFYGSPRFRMPIESTLIILAAYGIFNLKINHNKNFYLFLGSVIFLNIIIFFFSDSLVYYFKCLINSIYQKLPKA